MQRMTDLLFAENGVFHPDLDGRINSPGSQRVYQNRGGVLPRKRPSPNITPLYDTMVVESDNWKVTVREVVHQPGHIEPYAFRLETEEGVLVYSGDTGPCENIIELAKGADMLIHMCYFVTGTFIPAGKTVTSSGHKEAAYVAAEAGVNTLVATHFTPQMDAPGVKEQCLFEMAEMFKGRIVWGEDMMCLPLKPEEVPHAG
jgi:ribonuclease BN (tRNA processing enzyme)